MEDFKIHICTEDPCPVRDKECADTLNNGFTTTYINKNEPSRHIITRTKKP